MSRPHQRKSRSSSTWTKSQYKSPLLEPERHSPPIPCTPRVSWYSFHPLCGNCCKPDCSHYDKSLVQPDRYSRRREGAQHHRRRRLHHGCRSADCDQTRPTWNLCDEKKRRESLCCNVRVAKWAVFYLPIRAYITSSFSVVIILFWTSETSFEILWEIRNELRNEEDHPKLWTSFETLGLYVTYDLVHGVWINRLKQSLFIRFGIWIVELFTLSPYYKYYSLFAWAMDHLWAMGDEIIWIGRLNLSVRHRSLAVFLLKD